MEKRFLANGQEVGYIQTCYEVCDDESREYHLVRKVIGITETENYNSKSSYGEVEIYQGEFYYKLSETPAHRAPLIKQEEIASLEESIRNLQKSKRKIETEIELLEKHRRKTFSEMGCPFQLGDNFYRIDYCEKIIKETLTKIILTTYGDKLRWELYYGNDNYMGSLKEGGGSELHLYKTEEEAKEALKKRIIKQEEALRKAREDQIANAKKILEEAENERI